MTTTDQFSPPIADESADCAQQYVELVPSSVKANSFKLAGHAKPHAVFLRKRLGVTL